MIKVEFLGPIGKAPMEMEAATLADNGKWLNYST